jgi:membrane-bound ClpP family serine protease
MKKVTFAIVLLVGVAGRAVGGSPASAPATSGPAWTGTPCVVIPIRGVIGDDFTADRMKSIVDGVVKANVSTIVLDLNTPGGSVADAEQIVDIIIAHKEIRFIAFVRRALSAGATITLACKEIYVADGATIGAAVSFAPDASGRPTNLPKDVAEKFQSAWRAVCRKAAEFGGAPEHHRRGHGGSGLRPYDA